MAIVRNNVCSVGGESTVDEFVIIMVCCNQPELEMRCDVLHVFAFQQQVDDILCNNGRGFLLNDLLILFKNIIGYA